MNSKRIDIFHDVKNNNNTWGMITYIEIKNHLPYKRQEIIRFLNSYDEINYLKQNFVPGEVFFHKVDYDYIECRFYNGHPELDCIDIKYLEYDDTGKGLKPKSIKLPPEFEKMFIEIIKNNKGISPYNNLDSRYHRDVDVYEKRNDDRKEMVRSIKMSFEEFFSLTIDKIKKVAHNKKAIKGIKIFVSTAVLASLLTSGYNLVMDNEYNSDYLVQRGPIKNVQDVNIYMNKGKVGIIIEKLVENKYDEVTPDEIKYVIDYINDVNESNFDNNASFNSFSFSEYFNNKLDYHIDYEESTYVLKKIENLYSECFKTINGKVTLVPEKAEKYISYVSSLTFMYDTYHTERPKSYVDINIQSAASSYASSREIEIFDKCPAVLRYIIMNQLKGVLLRSNFEMKTKPSYYFKGTDKYSMAGEISNKMDSILDSMYFECGYSSGTKASR